MSTAPSFHHRPTAPQVRLGVKTKLFGLIIGTAVLALLAACVSFVLYDRESYAESKFATLTVLADAVADGAFGPVAFEDEASAQYVLRTIASERTALSAAIYLKDGKRLAEWSREEGGVALPEQLGADTPQGPKKSMSIRRPIVKDGNQAGEIVAVFSTRDIDARSAQFIKRAATVLLGAILLATIVVLFSHRVFTTPVRMLSEAATRVQAEGRFDVRVKATSQDELGVLTHAFNSMLEAVESRDAELARHRESLERTVEERTRDLDKRNQAMRLVLDTVDQGLVTLNLEGKVEQERSAQFDKWFPVGGDSSFGVIVSRAVPGFKDRFEIAYDQVGEGFLPPEITLDQLPAQMVSVEGATYALQYRPIFENGEVSRVLAIVTDVTDHIAREKADKEQRQVIAMFEQIAHDRAGFIEFLTDADTMVKQIVHGKHEDRAHAFRIVHTLKGNCAIFELSSVADCCHEVEEHCAESENLPTKDDLRRLSAVWDSVAERARALLGEVSDSLVIDVEDYQEILQAIRTKYPGSRLADMVERLSYEPVAPKLVRFKSQTERLAARLGIKGLEFSVDANRVRLPEGWSWLWGVIPHLLRNAVDHGLGARKAEGTPKIHLQVSESEHEICVQIEDNGHGVDWEKITAIAKERGLPVSTKSELARVLFADSVTTKDQATEVSGRGVGMAAVAQEVRSRGGSIEVASELGKGTSFTLRVPIMNNPVTSNNQSILARSLLPASVGVRSAIG